MIIALGKNAGVGKDTFADILVRRHGFAKVAFADPIKRIARDVYDFTEVQLWGPSAERNKPDLRYPRDHGPFKNDHCACCGWKFGSVELTQCYLTPRFALQIMGTEMGRTLYPDTWVRLALRVTETLLHTSHARYDPCRGVQFDAMGFQNNRFDPYKGVVISDLRFPNESRLVKEYGTVVELRRDGAGLFGISGLHESETHNIDPDFVLVNNGPIEDLVTMADQLITDIRAAGG